MKVRSRSTRLAVFEYEKEYIWVNINSYKRGSEIQGAQAAAKIKGMACVSEPDALGGKFYFNCDERD